MYLDEAIKLKSVLRQVAIIILLLPLISLQNLSRAAQSPASLSGDYQLHFEQTSKTCGDKISPVDVKVTINFSDTDVTMKFPSSFLGINILKAKYNPQSGTFDDQLEQSVSLGSIQATLAMAIKGKLVKQSGNSDIQFEVSFVKTADDPEWNCKVTGKGLAKKL